MTFSPTPEQLTIIDAAKTTPTNLLISALAGCAKTTTLVLIVKALPVRATLCLAFNKRIANEMKTKMPFHCECSTLNSLGHRAWGHAVGKRLTVVETKTADILKAHIAAQPEDERKLLWDNFASLLRSLRAAKTSGVLPHEYALTVEPLTTLEEFELDDDITLEDAYARDILDDVLTESIRQSFAGRIDYDDQLYMPTLFPSTFPNFPTVLVDEAQDLSPLNHAMLRKVARSRLIAVGDDNQSIYGFRGAMVGGMAKLKADWSMTELTLSTTFRCPQAIVRRAQARVPHFRWANGAPEGEVIDARDWENQTAEATNMEQWWTCEAIPDHSAIICRNNAPLFSTALTLIRAGRGINLVGSDIGPQLIKALKSFGEASLGEAEVLSAIDKWETSRIKKKPSSEAATRDRADCLRVFCEAGPTLGDAIRAAETIFSASGPIQLLSGHKAKGLEWDTVYHLDPWRVPSRYAFSKAAREQEYNLRYVIETRAKSRLILVNAEDLQ